MVAPLFSDWIKIMRPNQPERKMSSVQSAEAERAAAGWAAFRKLMAWIVVATLLTIMAGFAWLHASGAPARWELWAAAAGGIAGTMLLTGALMGLVFLSNRSGHDQSVGQADLVEERWQDEA